MQYVPFLSDMEIGFYSTIAQQKIDHLKLDDSPLPIQGRYEIRPGDIREQSCRMQIHSNAFDMSSEISTDRSAYQAPSGCCVAPGTIRILNTIEDYRNLDRAELLKTAGDKIWRAINTGSIYDDPSILASFLIICFADLKKYRFSYWFAFPALISDPPWAAIQPVGTRDQISHKTLTGLQSEALVDEVEYYRSLNNIKQHGFFLAKRTRRLGRTVASNEVHSQQRNPKIPFSQLGFRWQIASLSAHDQGFFEGEYLDDCYIAFVDPSNYGSELVTGDSSPVAAPGWPLRNLLTLVRQLFKRDRVQVLCYRDTPARPSAARSIIFDVELTKPSSAAPLPTLERPIEDVPKITGWERNGANKLASKLADLTEYMDPTRLADNAVDLNLKLMKWRITPNLDLDKIRSTKCLLLGAGTLGSYVARNLLGWGVRHITFVDNAAVSYSNPVRQPLFNFRDCEGGGRRKALRAAEALKEIYPGVEAEGYDMSVPMIGHPIMNVEQTKEDFERLERLVQEHDVVFELMDTRESRWLPTVLGKAYGKIVMNAALGFDSFLAMRHGIKTDQGVELGCYYCNDVVAPQNSTADRTLDQQCTVTRPGLAAIASATLVEIMVSILQHPLGAAAPAPKSDDDDDRGDHPLGLVPHTIRGFLSNFTQWKIVGQAYDCCSACSRKIVEAYRDGGWDFMLKALPDKDLVEELSGLKEVQRQAEAAAADMEIGSDNDDFGDEEAELL